MRGIISVRADMDPEKIVADFKESFEKFKAAQVEADKRVEELAKASGDQAKQAIEDAKVSAKKVQELADRLAEAEQKMVENVMSAKAAPKTLGQIVATSQAYKDFCDGKTSKMQVEASTIVGVEDSPATSSDTIVPTQRLPGIIPGTFRMLRVRDVLPSGTTSSNLVEYTRELAFTNNAAETEEKEVKPETDLTFELASAPVRTIAHWIKASTQVLSDAPMLQGYIDNRLRYGVELRIDNQLLNGDGTGQNISGMLDTGNFTAFTPTTGDTALDSINRAIYDVIGADYTATAIIMNPADWGAIERLKATDDHYIVGNPQGRIGPVLWGLPVVVTNNMTAGDFAVGAMDIAYQVWNRQGVVVQMFMQDEDNVQRNLVTIRSEARLALAIYRSASVYSGNLEI